MLYIGGFGFLVFLVVSSVFYTESSSSYKIYINDFLKVIEASIMWTDVLGVSKVYSYLNFIAAKTYYNEDKAIVSKSLQVYIDQYIKSLIEIILDSDDSAYEFITKTPLTLTFYHMENPTIYPLTNRSEFLLLAM